MRAVVVAATALLSLAGASRAGAQEPVVRDGFVEMRDGAGVDSIAFERMLLPATLGSAAGLALGAIAGIEAEWGGGDDPYVLGAFVFGLAGSALGTAAGIEIGSSGRAPFGTALASSLSGILVGFGTAWATANLLEDYEPAIFIGYAVGQGAFASMMTALIENR